ncbi:hypothetical protein LS71_007995 [Helicobacter jaachi]|uniref:Outer membrane beta-barrel protein n=1 Tax=Helicobacter jaachi TaxID=1677920 RepID=A0A4U8T721_9HELI|nr:hypothetical protein [Helicobacter jaachi]TLD95440.1 hypothetical protein LS71_007995 [Helicobacter jaachi]
MVCLKKIALVLAMAGTLAFGASNNNNLGTVKNQLLGNFASGSILNGSNRAGSVQRWYLFSEGHLGYSYSMLGDLNLHSADIGYSMYITAIRSASGLRPYVGTEITVPLYLKSTGNSNAFWQGVDTGLPGGTKVMTDLGFNGWGVQVPVIVGVQANYFYIQGMVGYAYHSFTDNFYISETQNDTTLDNIYHGLTYGLGAGVKVSNVFSIGLRYVRGEMTSSSRTAGAGINTNAVRTKDFKDEYQRFSIIFGVVF